MTTSLCTMLAVVLLFGIETSGKNVPHERFQELQDVVGHYSNTVCVRVAKKMKGGAEISKTAAIRIETLCDMLSDRLEHMVAVSGNDAMIQLHKKDRSAKRKKQYYREAVDTAGSGAHLQQLLKISRKATEWMLGTTKTPTEADISTRLQPDIGQWLINVASNSDPHVTSKEMRDEDPEEMV